MADDAARRLALLADERRRRVFAAVVLGARDRVQVADWTGIDPARVSQSLVRLEAAGLVERGDKGLVAPDAPYGEAARAVAAEARAARANPEPGEDPSIARFVRGGRITQIPVQRAKRLAVLAFVAETFPIDVDIPERDVNEIINRLHEDHALVRRYLVDEGFLTREAGIYRRSA